MSSNMSRAFTAAGGPSRWSASASPRSSSRLLLLVQIVRSVRREHIRVEYSMAWFGATALLLALSLSQTALDWLSRLFRRRRLLLRVCWSRRHPVSVHVFPVFRRSFRIEGPQHSAKPEGRAARMGDQAPGLRDRTNEGQGSTGIRGRRLKCPKGREILRRACGRFVDRRAFPGAKPDDALRGHCFHAHRSAKGAEP